MRCALSPCGRRRSALLVRVAGLGLYFEGAWYCCARCLDQAVRDRAAQAARTRTRASVPPNGAAAPSLRLGVVLATQVGLSQRVLSDALEAQVTTRMRLGAQLMAMGAVTEREVLRALAAQAGVPFLASMDAADVHDEAAVLSRDTARALALVPFAVDASQNAIRVACAAPLPRLALGIMAKMTGQGVEPYLVSDDRLAALLDAYCARPATVGRESGSAEWTGSSDPQRACEVSVERVFPSGPRNPLHETGRTEWRVESTWR